MTGNPRAPKTEPKKEYMKVVAVNRRARHDYFIEETLEAGIELHGSEVKSLRTGRVNFADSYARVYEGQCYLIGLQLSTYEKTSVWTPDPVRRRRLLLNKREIAKLQAKSERAGCTIIPLEILFRGSWAKVKLGLAKGKAAHDKRQAIKEALTKREIDRAMKQARRR